MPGNDTIRSLSAESKPRNAHWRTIGLASLFVAGAAGFLYFASGRGPRQGQRVANREFAIGKQLSALELAPLSSDAQPISLDVLRGHVTLLNLWGPWCTACRVEMPHVDALRKRWETQANFLFVSVACGPELDSEQVDALRGEALKYMRDKNLLFPVHCDPQGRLRWTLFELAQLHEEGLQYPVNVILAADGSIYRMWTGYTPGLEVEIATAVERELMK